MFARLHVLGSSLRYILRVSWYIAPLDGFHFRDQPCHFVTNKIQFTHSFHLLDKFIGFFTIKFGQNMIFQNVNKHLLVYIPDIMEVVFFKREHVDFIQSLTNSGRGYIGKQRIFDLFVLLTWESKVFCLQTSSKLKYYVKKQATWFYFDENLESNAFYIGYIYLYFHKR